MADLIIALLFNINSFSYNHKDFYSISYNSMTYAHFQNRNSLARDLASLCLL